MIALTAGALSACAHAPAKSTVSRPPPEIVAPEPQPPPAQIDPPVLDPAAATRSAVALLAGGEVSKARALLIRILAAAPQNAKAALLLKQIDQDPVALLGSKHVAYRVRKGDTLSEIASRRLGDPLLFYALGRYNGLASLNELLAGQVLKVPLSQNARKPARPAAKSKSRPNLTRALSTPPALAPAIDREAAKALKLQGLQTLNRGSPEAAIPLFERALALDPSDASVAQHLNSARALGTAENLKRLRLMALREMNAGDPKKAAALLERAVRLAPGNDIISRDLERARVLSTAAGQR